jgi:predicted nucleic acid-binding protein
LARFLLDTNIVSEPLALKPSPVVLAWLRENIKDSVFCAITVGELYAGAFGLPEGRKRDSLINSLDSIVSNSLNPILGFDSDCARAFAYYHSHARRIGLNPTSEDLMIAAICRTHGLVLATRNTKDFEYLDIEILNPFALGG